MPTTVVVTLRLVDEYAKEIRDLEAQIEAMVDAEDDPKAIAELEMQLDVLRAIYGRATDLHRAGLRDRELHLALAAHGYGDWTLDNVYAYVYESCVDLPAEGHRAFLAEIAAADLAGGLIGPGEAHG